MIRIDFLGTGNAFTPSGRLHALTLIDGKILIDTPPTLITQLRRKGLKTSEIEYLLFTHFLSFCNVLSYIHRLCLSYFTFIFQAEFDEMLLARTRVFTARQNLNLHQLFENL